MLYFGTSGTTGLNLRTSVNDWSVPYYKAKGNFHLAIFKPNDT